MISAIAAAAACAAGLTVVAFVARDLRRQAALAQLREAKTKLTCLKAASKQAAYRVRIGQLSQEEADDARKAWLSQLYEVQSLEKKLGEGGE